MLYSATVQDVTYLDPFLGPKVGTLYITDYKMYFKVHTYVYEGLIPKIFKD